MDAFVGFVPFHEAFRCGDEIQSKEIKDDKSKKFKTKVVRCSRDFIEMETDRDNDVSRMSRQEWDQARGNPLRLLINSFNGHFVINGEALPYDIIVRNLKTGFYYTEDSRQIEAAAVDLELQGERSSSDFFSSLFPPMSLKFRATIGAHLMKGMAFVLKLEAFGQSSTSTVQLLRL